MSFDVKSSYRPELTNAGLEPTHAVAATDEYGHTRELDIAGESPLTLYVDKREVVTLMTLGTYPEALAIGYLRNQGLVNSLHEIVSVQVDWETEAVAVTTRGGIQGIDEKLENRTVTTGCGQGTVFGSILEELDRIRLPRRWLKQSTIYHLLIALNEYNDVYKRAGAVHGCALCSENEILKFVEDVGRHNAVDAIAGMMWLDDIDGADKIFYTTGRLTSEMVIKVAQMGIPALLSRSGITQMGANLARKVGVTLIGRAKGRHFLIFNGREQIEFDAVPPVKPMPKREIRRG
ncbi:MAG TPA: formate dehydrogenase accessory sulfurtransferase FdhD [Gammaproteobacteria bacterium]|nr:formate dehydrogenase accessory sulfurtransferase FdhD [Gammaproteobacteria bacterium]